MFYLLLSPAFLLAEDLKLLLSQGRLELPTFPFGGVKFFVSKPIYPHVLVNPGVH